MGRENHQRVYQLYNELKSRGLVAWFDADRMTGEVVAQMFKGVEQSAVFIACITQRYVQKLSRDDNDNCKFEFNQARNIRQRKVLLPIHPSFMIS